MPPTHQCRLARPKAVQGVRQSCRAAVPGFRDLKPGGGGGKSTSQIWRLGFGQCRESIAPVALMLQAGVGGLFCGAGLLGSLAGSLLGLALLHISAAFSASSHES